MPNHVEQRIPHPTKFQFRETLSIFKGVASEKLHQIETILYNALIFVPKIGPPLQAYVEHREQCFGLQKLLFLLGTSAMTLSLVYQFVGCTIAVDSDQLVCKKPKTRAPARPFQWSHKGVRHTKSVRWTEEFFKKRWNGERS